MATKLTKCKYIDSLFDRGLDRSEVLEIINKEYPKANNSGTIAARYSIFNKENPDHLVKMTIENAKKKMLKKAKKDKSIDTDYIMLTAEEVHEVGGGFPKPAFVTSPDNGHGEVLIHLYFYVGDEKSKKTTKKATKKPAKKKAAKKATKKRVTKKKTKRKASKADAWFE